MPITHWLCPDHGEVALDHWNNNSCNAYSPQLMRSLTHDVLTSVHKGALMTPTTLLTCPRQTLIERFLPCVAKPHDHITPHVGTLAHRGLGTDEVAVAGVLFGLQMHGHIDRKVALDNEKNFYNLEDEKFTHPDNINPKYTPKEDHIAQMSMYKLLHEQTFTDQYIQDIYINYYAVGKSKYGHPPTMRCKVEPMDETTLLRHHPGGGDATLGQLVEAYQNEFLGVGRWAKTIDATNRKTATEMEKSLHEEVCSRVKSLPLYGATMYISKRKGTNKCNSYCGVNETCLVQIEGRPGLLL